MRRYYICDLLRDDKGRWVPALRDALAASGDLTAAFTVATGDFDANGNPTPGWCLCVVEAKDHQTLGALPGVDLLPDFPLDSKVGSMHVATKNAMLAALNRRGVPSTVVTNADGYRDVITGIAVSYLNNAGFSADSFNP